MPSKIIESKIAPREIAKYFLLRASKDGDLISPLKMQKLVYFAYALYLVRAKGKKKLFEESIEAWPAGPVIPSLYRELKKYGSMPINPAIYVDIAEEDFATRYSKEIVETLNDVYESCEKYTPFELMVLSHKERAWFKARKGLAPNEQTNNILKDDDILEQHLK